MGARATLLLALIACRGPQTPSNASPCEGASLDLLAAIASPACRTTEQEADALRAALEDPAKTPLRVEASLIGDDRVELRIINTGASAATLPLFVHSTVDTFATRAGDKHLTAPAPEWPAGFAFDVGRMTSKIVLPPAGVARARMRITPKIATADVSGCPPNAKCAPDVQTSPLSPGSYELEIGTPLYASRADLVAKLACTKR